MADRISLLQEADRRGILPPELKGAFDEAKRRGLVSAEPETGTRRGYASGLARAAWQGATLSFGDEINAAARAGYNALTGQGDFGPSYDEALKDEREAYREFSDENPVTSFTAGIAGGIVPALVAPGAAGVRYLQAAKSAPQALKRGAAVGSGYGAVSGYGAGGGETTGDGVANRLESSTVGSVVGAGLGAGGGYVGHRVGEAVAGARQARAEVDQPGGAYNTAAKALSRDKIDPGTLRDDMLPKEGTKVTKDIASEIMRLTNSGMDQASIAAQMGLAPKTVGNYQKAFRHLNETPLTIVDRATLQGPGAGQNVQWTMRAAAATPGEARTSAAERLTERQVGQGGRLVDAFQRYIGDGDLEGRIAQLQDHVRAQETAAYKSAYANEQPFDLMPVVNKWNQIIAKDRGPLGRAVGQAIDAFFDETQVHNPTGTNSFKRLDVAKTLQRFQQGKDNLDYFIEQSFKDGRPTRLTRSLTQLKRDLMGEVRKSNPAWAQANDLFSDGRAGDKALAAGEALATNLGSKSREALQAFDKMDVTQKELFRQGFSRMLQDRALNKPDGHDVTAQLRTAAARKIFRRVMDRGPAPAGLNNAEKRAWNRARRQEAANGENLLRVIAEEAAGTRTFRALQGGSQTTPLREAIDDLNAPAYLTSFRDFLKPTAYWDAAVSQIARRVYSGRNNALMEMLTETDPVKQMEILEAIQRYSGARSAGGSQADALVSPATNSLIAEQRRPGTDIAPTTDDRFTPPMRLGGPKPADGAFEPTTPTPGNVPPQAEIRSYTPSPSESAAFYARQGAEAIGISPTQAEQFGSGIGNAVNFFTPTDAVSDALQTGSAASAAEAGLSFIPGFRGGKAAAGKALELARKELDDIQREASRLFSDEQVARIMGPSPVPAIPGRAVPDDVMLTATKDRAARLQKAIDDKRDELARRPQSRTSVPATTTAQQREVSRYIEDTPTIAIPGRQGFAPKDEQKRLVQQHFQGGGDLPPAPWGRTAHMAREDVKRILAEAHAAGRKVPDRAVSTIEDAARKADDAAEKLQELRAFSDAAPNRGDVQSLQRQLGRAEKDATFWRAQYEKIKKQHFGD